MHVTWACVDSNAHIACWQPLPCSDDDCMCASKLHCVAIDAEAATPCICVGGVEEDGCADDGLASDKAGDVVHSSREQQGMHSALNSAAVHWCWVIAHLYVRQICIGVTAATQHCCRPVLHSSCKQQGIHSALNSAAVHWYWVIAHLYERQICIGVIAAIQDCCLPVLQSSCEQ